ncbi:MAG: flavin reductase family protein [Actinomycetota bacterium]|nr:flavin reductase family protein [Actinomycetota bacterium]
MSFLGDDPFAVSAELRDPTRRLRGQLVSPVTVWTTNSSSSGDVGLTVASVLVVEGDEPAVLGLIGPLSDFFEALEESGRFVVHVLGARDRRLAELFAGALPEPEPFTVAGATPSPFGPRLSGVSTVAGCAVLEVIEVGYSRLVRGAIRALEVSDAPGAPLSYYRGRYGTVAEP